MPEGHRTNENKELMIARHYAIDMAANWMPYTTTKHHLSRKWTVHNLIKTRVPNMLLRNISLSKLHQKTIKKFNKQHQKPLSPIMHFLPPTHLLQKRFMKSSWSILHQHLGRRGYAANRLSGSYYRNEKLELNFGGGDCVANLTGLCARALVCVCVCVCTRMRM